MHLSSLSVVEFEVIAGLEIVGDHRVGVLLYISCQHLLRDVVVVQFMVAHGQVHVESQHVSEVGDQW